MDCDVIAAMLRDNSNRLVNRKKTDFHSISFGGLPESSELGNKFSIAANISQPSPLFMQPSTAMALMGNSQVRFSWIKRAEEDSQFPAPGRTPEEVSRGPWGTHVLYPTHSSLRLHHFGNPQVLVWAPHSPCTPPLPDFPDSMSQPQWPPRTGVSLN